MDRKFVVLKSVAGWGDRLQCLLQAIGYSRKTGRSLVVDWRDSDWTHDRDEPIEKWFSFKGIHTTPLSDFLTMSGVSDPSVFPEVWKPVLASPEYQRWIYSKEYYDAVDHDHIWGVVSGAPDHGADVVVCPGVGKRTFAYSDCGAIVLAPWLKERISRFAAEMGLKTGGYDVVHLRGGSKSWAGGFVPLKSLDEMIKRAWPTKESYLEEMHAKYRESLGSDKPQEVVILTDTGRLARDWIDRFSTGIALPTFNEHLHESGVHKLSADKLAPHGVGKEDLNYETLRDFCIMLNARRVVGDGMSIFSSMGDRCRGAGVRMVEFSL